MPVGKCKFIGELTNRGSLYKLITALGNQVTDFSPFLVGYACKVVELGLGDQGVYWNMTDSTVFY